MREQRHLKKSRSERKKLTEQGQRTEQGQSYLRGSLEASTHFDMLRRAWVDQCSFCRR